VDTRTRITEKALELFNTRGAHSVTTNHIARELGISPGNLYYHFRNKEEIIRNIFEGILLDFDRLWVDGIADDPGPAGFTRILEAMCDLYLKYRFFYLEIAALLAQDADLRKQYQKNYKNRLAQQTKYYETLASLGYVKAPEGGNDTTSIMTAAWIVSDQWLTHLTISGRSITRESVRECLPVLFALVRPYLTRKGLREIGLE